MRIILVSYSNSLPTASAAFNRTLCYSKALKELGHNVSMIFASAADESAELQGTYESIPFIFVLRKQVWDNMIVKRLQSLFAVLKTIPFLKKLHADEKIDYLRLPTTRQLNNLFLIRFCKKNNIKLLHERSEFPDITLATSSFPKKAYRTIDRLFYLTYTLKAIDVLLVITEKLRQHYGKLISPKCQLYHLPLIVERNRFEATTPYKHPRYYIAYIGSFNFKHNGVNILIEAFARIIDDFDGLKLLLIGPKKPQHDYNRLVSLVDKLGIANRVILTGEIRRDEVPKYLLGAQALAIAKPNSYQSKGAFPNKLGEYLMTGKPVIATTVGEIPKYLTDGQNAFLSEPDDVDSFSNKLTEALNHPKREEIGKRGKETALEYFDSLTQSTKLADFLKQQLSQ